MLHSRLILIIVDIRLIVSCSGPASERGLQWISAFQLSNLRVKAIPITAGIVRLLHTTSFRMVREQFLCAGVVEQTSIVAKLHL